MATGEPGIVVSLTSHERVDVLVQQLCNVFDLLPASTWVVLHRSANWQPLLDPDQERFWEGTLCGSFPRLIINPMRFATRWAHMFHAHISNIQLANEMVDWDKVMLLSSGDVIFRPGLADYIHSAACGATVGVTGQKWGWFERVVADPVAHALAAEVGSAIRSGLHEGTFYQREMMLQMISLIEKHVVDWEYNDAYPKEEVFFPTLPAASCHEGKRRPSYLLWPKNSRANRQAFQAACRHLGEKSTREEDVTSTGGKDQTYILSRVQRTLAHPLRVAAFIRSSHIAGINLPASMVLDPHWRLMTEFAAASGPLDEDQWRQCWDNAHLGSGEAAYFQNGHLEILSLDKERKGWPVAGRILGTDVCVHQMGAGTAIAADGAALRESPTRIAFRAKALGDDSRLFFRKQITLPEAMPPVLLVSVIINLDPGDPGGIRLWFEPVVPRANKAIRPLMMTWQANNAGQFLVLLAFDPERLAGVRDPWLFLEFPGHPEYVEVQGPALLNLTRQAAVQPS